MQKKISAAHKKAIGRYGHDKSFAENNYPLYALFKNNVRIIFSCLSVSTGVMYIVGEIRPAFSIILAAPTAIALALYVETLKYKFTPIFFALMFKRSFLKCAANGAVCLLLYAASVFWSVSFIIKYANANNTIIPDSERASDSGIAALIFKKDSLLLINSNKIDAVLEESKKTMPVKETGKIDKLMDGISYLQKTKRTKLMRAKTDTSLDAGGVRSYYDGRIATKKAQIKVLRDGMANKNIFHGMQADKLKTLKVSRSEIHMKYDTLLAKARGKHLKNNRAAAYSHRSTTLNLSFISYFIEFMIIISMFYGEWYMWKIFKGGTGQRKTRPAPNKCTKVSEIITSRSRW